MGSQDWQVLGLDEQFDAARDAGLPSDQGQALESGDHLVDGWGGNVEVSLHVGFGRWASVDLGVGPDEGEVLALFVGEARRRRAIMVKQLIHC
jgi:hypothetical protein